MSSNIPPHNSSRLVTADIRDDQLLHLPTLFWLLDQDQSSRGTGRTHLIAIAWIMTAQDAGGYPVAGFDHHMQSKKNLEYVKDHVLRIMDTAGIHGSFTNDNCLKIPRSNVKLSVPNLFRRYVRAFIGMCFREGLKEEEIISMMRDDIVNQVLGA